MTLRRTAFGAGLLLLAGQLAHASTSDILIGLDEKITYGPDGQVNGARARMLSWWWMCPIRRSRRSVPVCH